MGDPRQPGGASDGLHAIVLAAGAGTRFGGGKLLAPYGGRPLIERALEAAEAAPVGSVVVALQQHDDALLDEVRRLAERATVVMGDFREGMSATLRAALARLPPDANGVFVFLGDMPRIPHAILPALAKALEGHLAAAPVCGGRRGHPVLIGAPLFPELGALKGDQGARAILDRLGPRLALVPTDDDGVLFDVDTRNDLSR